MDNKKSADNTKRIETNRLILRKFVIDDYAQMFDNWAKNEEVARYVSYTHHKDYEETKEIINKWISEYENGSYHWAAELKETGELIGNISLVKVSERNKIAEFGYVFGQEYWNKGYATEALNAVLEYLFTEKDFYMIEGRYCIDNQGSGKVMEKAGLKMDGILRGRFKYKDKDGYGDVVVRSITKEEYLNKKRAKIRSARLSDIDNGLLDICMEGYEYHKGCRPDVFPLKSRADMRDEIIKSIGNKHVIVITYKSKLAGFASYDIDTKHNRVFINELVVKTDYRRRGFAKRLINELKDIAKRNHCARLEWNCWVFNETAMLIYDRIADRQRLFYEMSV